MQIAIFEMYNLYYPIKRRRKQFGFVDQPAAKAKKTRKNAASTKPAPKKRKSPTKKKAPPKRRKKKQETDESDVEDIVSEPEETTELEKLEKGTSRNFVSVILNFFFLEMEEELTKKEDAMNDDPDSENDPELNELTKQAEEKQAVSVTNLVTKNLSHNLDEKIEYFGSGGCSSSNKCLGTKS